MEDERITRNFEALLAKLRQSGDLPGLQIQPDEPTGKLVGGMAMRLMRGSKRIAIALIGCAHATPAIPAGEEVALVGDEAAEQLARRIGTEFINAEGLARLLARLVVTSLSPASERTVLADSGLAKVEQLKAYFQQQMAEVAVDVRQTDSDFDVMLTSFFFHNEGAPPIHWLWCLKVPNGVLADLKTSEIIEHLEHHRWAERLQEAPAGTVFIAAAYGLDVWKPKTKPNP